MTIGEVRDAVHATLLCGGEMVDEEVLCACGSDLMSDVLAFSKDTAVLLTGLCNPQSIRTAEMMDVKCILYVRDKKPTLDMISMADEAGIALLSTGHRMFTACGLLYAAGMRGGSDYERFT